jgi:hypothetical protein
LARFPVLDGVLVHGMRLADPGEVDHARAEVGHVAIRRVPVMDVVGHRWLESGGVIISDDRTVVTGAGAAWLRACRLRRARWGLLDLARAWVSTGAAA